MVVGLINYHNMVLIHGNIGNGHKNRGMRLLYLPCRGTEQCHPVGRWHVHQSSIFVVLAIIN